MEKLPLHRKYRPRSFKEFVGNDKMIEAIEAKVLEGTVTTFLLQGPSGCGKTTLSRIIAKKLGARGSDIKEMNISNTRGIDTARQIIEMSRYRAMNGKSKAIILNEVHSATKDWQNAMLEILEEPPPSTYFILCTTDPSKLLLTVRNRCTTFQVSQLKTADIKFLLNKIIKEENSEFPTSAIDEIAKASDGSPRRALVLLDSVIDMQNDKDIIDVIQKDTGETSETIDLCRALIAGKNWKEVSKILKDIKEDPESVRYAILGYMTSVLLNKGDQRTAEIISLFTESFMYQGKAGLVASCFFALKV